MTVSQQAKKLKGDGRNAPIKNTQINEEGRDNENEYQDSGLPARTLTGSVPVLCLLEERALPIPIGQTTSLSKCPKAKIRTDTQEGVGEPR